MDQKKVVIVGEFSGLGESFSIGYARLGMKVMHINSSDGYKRMGKGLPSNRYLDLVLMITKALKIIVSQKNYFVIFLSPFVFKRPLFVNRLLNYLILFRSSRSVYYACTSDSFYWRHYPHDADRYPLMGFISDLGYKTHRYAFSDKYYKYNKLFVNSVDKVFVASEEYELVYNGFAEITLLRYPVAIITSVETDNTIKSIKFLHGITRPGIKGSDCILRILEESGVDFRILEKTPFTEFLQVLSATKSYLDQYHSHYPGMAALIALQFCDFVFTGIDKNLISDETYKEECPFVDLRTILPKELKSYQDVSALPKRNIEFLKRYHDPQKIAFQSMQ